MANIIVFWETLHGDTFPEELTAFIAPMFSAGCKLYMGYTAEYLYEQYKKEHDILRDVKLDELMCKGAKNEDA
jgi:2-iminoacetate synthase ThiH